MRRASRGVSGRLQTSLTKLIVGFNCPEALLRYAWAGWLLAMRRWCLSCTVDASSSVQASTRFVESGSGGLGVAFGQLVLFEWNRW